MFRFSFDRSADAIDLLGDSSPRRTEADVAQGILHFVSSHRGAAHISAQVLADKAELIRTMLYIGFVITGYLPAWHWHEGARYDCVMLVKRQREDTPSRNGLESEIDQLNLELATLAVRFQGPAAPSRRPS
jgi:hypothetical protein